MSISIIIITFWPHEFQITPNFIYKFRSAPNSIKNLIKSKNFKNLVRQSRLVPRKNHNKDFIQVCRKSYPFFKNTTIFFFLSYFELIFLHSKFYCWITIGMNSRRQCLFSKLLSLFNLHFPSVKNLTQMATAPKLGKGIQYHVLLFCNNMGA